MPTAKGSAGPGSRPVRRARNPCRSRRASNGTPRDIVAPADEPPLSDTDPSPLSILAHAQPRRLRRTCAPDWHSSRRPLPPPGKRRGWPGRADRIADRHALDPSLRAKLMLVPTAAGNRAGAFAVYDGISARLHDGLGTGPGPHRAPRSGTSSRRASDRSFRSPWHRRRRQARPRRKADPGAVVRHDVD
ncbi:bacterial transcriptional activator domain-containing protein [Streptomyces graminilatus]|uniref:BTAD domain-containing putative transcriptional regulator n=1 Tax=Streptomyces graminilatus TaxID=1464070 RepID=UPI000D14E8F8